MLYQQGLIRIRGYVLLTRLGGSESGVFCFGLFGRVCFFLGLDCQGTA